MDNINYGLDGKNVDAVLTEFGIRLHRVIFEHLQQFQYSSMGESVTALSYPVLCCYGHKLRTCTSARFTGDLRLINQGCSDTLLATQWHLLLCCQDAPTSVVYVCTTGAMLAICDVNEYRKCVKEFGLPQVQQLFDTLHALCNLLVVVPDNLKQVCTGEQLVSQ